jgi:hypothetical protein
VISRQHALDDLGGTTCACGRGKARGMSHCRQCYFKLPKPMRDALYQRVGHGYEEAYQASLDRLGLQSPSAFVEATAKAALSAGARDVMDRVARPAPPSSPTSTSTSNH